MDELRIQRAHIVGWSMGGGVVLSMAELAPERVASITMLAAIGDQRTEGSGSYTFEHAKYALGRGALHALYVAAPHFGAMPSPRTTIAYSLMRNFGDTDQRPLTTIMQRLRIPTLIIAGRDDFLVPMRAARLHHQLIAPSELVVMDAMHFMPFLQADLTASLISDFADHDARHDPPIERRTIHLAPERTPPFGMLGRAGLTLLESIPWWAVVTMIAMLVWRRPFLGSAATVALINAIAIDWGVGLLGVFTGIFAKQAQLIVHGLRQRNTGAGVSCVDWQRRFSRQPPGLAWAWPTVFRPDLTAITPRAVGQLGTPFQVVQYLVGAFMASAAWTAAVCLPLLIVAALVALRLRELAGWTGSAVSVLTLWFIATLAPLPWTWTGRRMLLAKISKTWRHEYWPSWIFYAPLVPYVGWLVFRAQRLMPFTACNPGIPRGGGLIGESKTDLLTRTTAPPGTVLDAVLIAEHTSPSQRAEVARSHVGVDKPVGDYPVIVKPDAGQRGFGVHIIRDSEQLEPYFKSMTRAASLQRYHPGPHEVGVMWARRLDRSGRDTGTGMIYSITRKEFPFIVGDGQHTLEQLIYRHPRYRRQASTFLARFADDASRVVPTGERVRLAQSGNHCQGTLFRDGADLATPQLLQALDEISFAFEPPAHFTTMARGGLDIARFDLRFVSEDDLRAGRNFGIIEINGTAGESTNLYDPARSIFWAYRVLFGQWRLLYELGDWRRRQGVPTWSIWMLVRSLRQFYRDRPGSALAD